MRFCHRYQLIFLYIVIEGRQHAIHHVPRIPINRNIIRGWKEQALHTVTLWNKLQDRIFACVWKLARMERILQKILFVKPDQPCLHERVRNLFDTIPLRD